jgi:hypothetical protein
MTDGVGWQNPIDFLLSLVLELRSFEDATRVKAEQIVDAIFGKLSSVDLAVVIEKQHMP